MLLSFPSAAVSFWSMVGEVRKATSIDILLFYLFSIISAWRGWPRISVQVLDDAWVWPQLLEWNTE
jgi:hypothetical protein